MTVQEIEELIQKLISYRDLLRLQERLKEEVDLSSALSKVELEVQEKLKGVKGVWDVRKDTEKVGETS